MDLLVTTTPGQVVKLSLGDNALPGSIGVGAINTGDNLRGQITDFGIDIPVIFTGISFSQAEKHQFTTSLDEQLYLYTFGKEVSQANIQGMGFAAEVSQGDNCSAEPGPEQKAGINYVLDFYDETKISKVKEVGEDTKLPQIQVRIGSQVYRGYLVGCSVELSDTTHLIARFNLNVKALYRVNR